MEVYKEPYLYRGLRYFKGITNKRITAYNFRHEIHVETQKPLQSEIFYPIVPRDRIIEFAKRR